MVGCMEQEARPHNEERSRGMPVGHLGRDQLLVNPIRCGSGFVVFHSNPSPSGGLAQRAMAEEEPMETVDEIVPAAKVHLEVALRKAADMIADYQETTSRG